MKNATVVQRFFSRIIDGVIFAIIGIVIYAMNDKTNEQLKVDIIGGLFGVRWLLYYPILEYTGGTVGKWVVNIRTVSNVENSNVTLFQGYKKVFFLFIPTLVGLLVLFLGLIVFRDMSPSAYYGYTFMMVIFQQLWMYIAPLITTKSGARIHDSFAGLKTITGKGIWG